MKVLLYSEALKRIKQSGLGKAIEHQKKALELNNISYTTDPKDSFDVMHINTYFLKSVIFAKEVRRKGIPVVYHAHSTAEDFRNSFKLSNQLTPLFKLWIQHAYRQSDLIITPTPYSKRLLDTYGLDREIIPISNGINLERFRPIENARQKFREKYSYHAQDFIIMGIGLYIKRKGFLDFIQLAHDFPELKFIWFGAIDLSIVPEEIRQAIYHKPDNLALPGYVPNDDIVLALQGSDLYLFPTFEETEGIPAIEACASRTPFIVRDIPVFDDWLTHGKNTYKAQNLDEFKYYIKQAHQGALPNLTNTAYEVAASRDLEIIGKQLIQAYEKVLK